MDKGMILPHDLSGREEENNTDCRAREWDRNQDGCEGMLLVDERRREQTRLKTLIAYKWQYLT